MECQTDQKRLRIELAYTGSPSDVALELLEITSGVIIIDNSLFAVKQAEWAGIKNATLHIDRCLGPGSYSLSISSSLVTNSAEEDDGTHSAPLTVPVTYYYASLQEEIIMLGQEESKAVVFNVTGISPNPSPSANNLAFSSQETNSGIRVPSNFCFSGRVIVEEKTRGLILMSEVKLGDELLGPNGVYNTVYMFGHKEPTQRATMLQIWPSKLEVSADHLVFILGRGFIPASMICVGDQLSNGHRVENVREIQRVGIFAPFTMSGALVVNGVVASNYVSLQDSEVLSISSLRTPLSFHWLEHASLAPYRISVYLLGKRNYTEDGYDIGLLKVLGFTFLRLHTIPALMTLPALLIILCFFTLVESCAAMYAYLSLAFLLVFVGCSYTLKSKTHNRVDVRQNQTATQR